MKTNGTHDVPADIASLLALSEADADAAHLVSLCRRSAFLRRWLRTEFFRFEHVREGFMGIVDAPPAGVKVDAGLLRRLASRDDLLSDTQRTIRNRLRVDTGRIYGGLSWSEVEKLVRRYHAGTLDIGAFLLVHDWRASTSRDGISPRLLDAVVVLLDEAIRGRDKRLLRHVLKAVDFLDEFTDARSRRVALGHVNWWKVSVLLYLLNHPKPAYRTRELRAHLAAQGLDIETQEVRRFCSRHGIKRDMRAGRPPRLVVVPAKRL